MSPLELLDQSADARLPADPGIIAEAVVKPEHFTVALQALDLLDADEDVSVAVVDTLPDQVHPAKPYRVGHEWLAGRDNIQRGVIAAEQGFRGHAGPPAVIVGVFETGQALGDRRRAGLPEMGYALVCRANRKTEHNLLPPAVEMRAELLNADQMWLADDEHGIAGLEEPADADDEFGEIEWRDIVCRRCHDHVVLLHRRDLADAISDLLAFPVGHGFDAVKTADRVMAGIAVPAVMAAADADVVTVRRPFLRAAALAVAVKTYRLCRCHGASS